MRQAAKNIFETRFLRFRFEFVGRSVRDEVAFVDDEDSVAETFNNIENV